jgi:hypothetical protein
MPWSRPSRQSRPTAAPGTTGNHTINGSQFLPGAIVLFVGSAEVTVNSVTFVSPTKLTVSLTVPAGTVTASTIVVVVNPAVTLDKGAAAFCGCFRVM